MRVFERALPKLDAKHEYGTTALPTLANDVNPPTDRLEAGHETLVSEPGPTSESQIRKEKIVRKSTTSSIQAVTEASGAASSTRCAYKRQLTDKYSAEKNKHNKRLGASDKIEEASEDKTRLSFPSDFSQVVGSKKRDTMGGIGYPTFRRSGTLNEKQERFKKGTSSN